MCKKTSSRWSAAKALLVLPLVAVSLAATATTVYVPHEVQDKVTENSVNDKSEKTQVVKISKGKIYLNGEKITIEELKAKVAEWDSVTIEADKDVKMGDVAELKEALRENGTLKVNYLLAENEPKQNKKASAEEAPVAEEKERVATVSEQPKDVATIVVKENKKYLYNGKEIKDESELMRLLEEYECETINVVLETTNTTPLLLHILPKVAKNVNYKYVLAEQDATQALTTFKTNLRTRIQTRISNADCAMGVVYADVNLGRTGYVTTGNITVGDNVSSDVAPRLVKRVQDALNNIFFTNIRTEEPLSTRLEIVFAKNEGGKILPENVTVGQDAIWVVGYDENVADANVHGRVIDAKTKKQVPNVAVLIKEKSIGVFADESGQYIIKGQPEGIYTLIASAVGYKSAEKSVSIAPDKNVEVNFELEENVVSLNEVTISSDTKVAEVNAKAAAAKVQEAANAQAAAEAKVAEDGDMPYVKVEKMPTFMGGDLNVFRNWVQSKIQYP